MLARAQGEREAEARAFVDLLAREAIAAVDDAPAQRAVRLLALVDGAFDLDAMAQLALGGAWRRAAPGEREAYREAFGRWVLATYADRFAAFRLQRLEVGAAALAGRDVVVQSRAVGAGLAGDVAWRLRGEVGALRVIDLVVEGVSLIVTHRGEFTAIAERRGVAGLTDQLRRSAENCRLCAFRE